MPQPNLGEILRDADNVLKQYQENIRQRLRMRLNPIPLRASVERRINQLVGQLEELMRTLDRQMRSLPASHRAGPRQQRDYIRTMRDGILGRFGGLTSWAAQSVGSVSRVAAGPGAEAHRWAQTRLQKAIDELPAWGTNEAERQLERGIRKALDSLLPDELVQPDQRGDLRTARRATADVLYREIRQLPLVRDTFKIIEGVLGRIGRFFEARLPILRSNIAMRERIQLAGRVDARSMQDGLRTAGRQWNGAATEAERSLRNMVQEDRIRVRGRFSLRPKLVLDPSRFFLDKISASAGIEVKNHSFRFRFDVEVKIDNPLPLNDSTRFSVKPRAELRLGRNWNIFAEMEASRGRRGNWTPRAGAGVGFRSDDGRVGAHAGWSFSDGEHRGTFSLEIKF